MMKATSAEAAKAEFSKFQGRQFRENQQEAIEFIHDSTKRVNMLSAPTGAGKSLIGMCSAKMHEGRVLYLVHSKALQRQLKADFPEAVLLMGRGNYPCKRGEFRDAAQCFKQTKCKDCVYQINKRRAQSADLAILNYSYWLTEANYVGSFSGASMVIMDEGDKVKDILEGHTSIQVNSKVLDTLGMGAPKYRTTEAAHGLDSWKEWGANLIEKSMRQIERIDVRFKERDMFEGEKENEELLNERQLYKGVLNKAELFFENVDRTWIFEERHNRDSSRVLSFKPTWITPSLARRISWDHIGKKVVIMSATFMPVAVEAKMLGLNVGEIDYMELPSTFHHERRRVYRQPVANLTFKTMDDELPRLINKIKDILAHHHDVKGVIHTVSYTVAKAILSIESPRFITHDSRNRDRQIARFRDSEEPLVLVSPSNERGVSFDDDMCRFIIWAKAPYLSLADKQVNKRVYGSGPIGNLWYKSDMLNTVIQGAGRGMRNENDWCITYILDKQICKAMEERPTIMPKWFREALY